VYLIMTFCFPVKTLIQSNKVLVFNVKSKKEFEEIYLSHGFLKIPLDEINDVWMENHKCDHAQYQK